MKRSFPYIFILFALSTSGGASQNQSDSFLSLLPTETKIAGWSRVDSVRVYRGEDLFHFIDGGADIFFEYGFRQAQGIEYQNAGEESITLEIYEMNDPGAAYGIYSIRIADGAIPIDIGQEGSAHPYYIMFWKDKYFVSITSSDSTLECRKGLVDIARAVDQSILQQGQRPAIVNLLPDDNLIKRRYFRGFLGISTIRVLDEKDIFHAVEGTIGTYKDHTLLVVKYGNAPEAKRRMVEIEAYFKSNRRFKDYEHRDQISEVTDSRNRVLCFGRSKAYLVIAIASDESVARSSLKKGTALLDGR